MLLIFFFAIPAALLRWAIVRRQLSKKVSWIGAIVTWIFVFSCTYGLGMKGGATAGGGAVIAYLILRSAGQSQLEKKVEAQPEIQPAVDLEPTSTPMKANVIPSLLLWCLIGFVAGFAVFKIAGGRYYIEGDTAVLRDSWTGKFYFKQSGKWMTR